MSETEGARPVVTLELRGRDLALTPPAAWWSRDDDDLYAALFGQSEAGGAALLLRRDLRGRCGRAGRPLWRRRARRAPNHHHHLRIRAAPPRAAAPLRPADLRRVPSPARAGLPPDRRGRLHALSLGPQRHARAR